MRSTRTLVATAALLATGAIGTLPLVAATRASSTPVRRAGSAFLPDGAYTLVVILEQVNGVSTTTPTKQYNVTVAHHGSGISITGFSVPLRGTATSSSFTATAVTPDSLHVQIDGRNVANPTNPSADSVVQGTITEVQGNSSAGGIFQLSTASVRPPVFDPRKLPQLIILPPVAGSGSQMRQGMSSIIPKGQTAIPKGQTSWQSSTGAMQALDKFFTGSMH